MFVSHVLSLEDDQRGLSALESIIVLNHLFIFSYQEIVFSKMDGRVSCGEETEIRGLNVSQELVFSKMDGRTDGQTERDGRYIDSQSLYLLT